MEKKKKKFKMPHAYVIIFIMTIFTAVLANIVPAGEFERVVDVYKRQVQQFKLAIIWKHQIIVLDALSLKISIS